MENIEKFKDLLKKLFQFEASDLDFGIYRILNYRRDEIEKFIQKDLVKKVKDALDKYEKEIKTNIDEEFESAKKEIIDSLGKEAFITEDELKEEYKNTPIGKKFLTIKEQKEEIERINKEENERINEIKSQVFNDLYTFFSRYYEDGDFVPQYRYSIKRSHIYAIPYNGEEVKLYWSNSDQYYTKTGLLFRDYTFKTYKDDYKVIFRIVSAKEELGSNKATKERFFVLDDETPVELQDKTVIICFQYRELTDKEVKRYDVESGSNAGKQEKINQKSYEEILAKINDAKLRAYLGRDENGKPFLLYHISKFTSKNTSDYFIHKNLKKFLTEQLDYFIKAEVLDTDTLIKTDTLVKKEFLNKHITRAKVVQEIGENIIDFLSQIEDFQKKLWEKKKFVLKTEYVITTDRVPEEFYDEILENKEQKREWDELGFEIPKVKEELKDKKLPIDTKHFSIEFKEKLLEKLTEKADLDDLLDGLLIKSENWQALNTILNKYREKIKTIYIDPPYNTGNDGFLYRNGYQHSSWLTMMENRLSLAKELMSDDGVIFVSIDDNEVYNLKKLLDVIFSESNYITNFCWEKTQHFGRQKINFYANRDFILTYAKELKTDSNQLKELLIESIKAELEDAPLYNASNPEKELVFPKGTVLFRIPDGTYTTSKDSKFKLIEPVTVINHKNIQDLKLRFRSRWSQEKIFEEIEKGSYFLIKSNKFSIRVVYGGNIASKEAPKQIIFTNENNPLCTKDKFGNKIGTNEEGSKEIKSLFNDGSLFSYPKPSSLIKYLISLRETNFSDSFILDFFAGSGTTAHAVMKLNKEDGGKRKFILVEMGNYFDTVIIPRVKKVAYSFNWEDGRPQDTDGIGGFFKYQILEQYEDTLENIELQKNQSVEELFKDQYLLKYFLDYETRESPYLLNIDYLKNPFVYKLKVNLEEVGAPQEMVVDIPETFNYLLGLKIKKIKTRKNGRKYLFILGEKEGKDYAIVWREYNDEWSSKDCKKDKEFIIQELEDWTPHVVYINGQSALTPKNFEIRLIEPEFTQG